jgi:hypothetical protein
MADVTLSLHSFSDWGDRLARLVELLDSHGLFRPSAWGPYEPARYKFTLEDVPRMEERWKKYTGLGFSKEEPRMSIQLVRRLQARQSNLMVVSVDASYLNTDAAIQSYLKFASELFGWGDVLHGYACHETEFRQTNKLLEPTLINNKLIVTGGMDLRDCLPGVYWANFFGEPYINWFGRERFVSLLSYEQYELPNNGILILTSPSPIANAETNSYKSTMRTHLGEDAFFDIRTPTRACRSPFKDGTLLVPDTQVPL